MEFLIQRLDGVGLHLDPALYAAVLRPNTYSHRLVAGWGAHRIEVQGCPIVFGFEDHGITVTFQNWLLSEDVMVRIAEEIASNVSRAVGSPAHAVEQ
jgi:hypothetical protein